LVGGNPDSTISADYPDLLPLTALRCLIDGLTGRK
jgi:hypothetical protein